MYKEESDITRASRITENEYREYKRRRRLVKEKEMSNNKIMNLSADEFKNLIHDAVYSALEDYNDDSKRRQWPKEINENGIRITLEDD